MVDIGEIIKKQIDKLVTEKQSISNEVTECVTIMLQQIANAIQNRQIASTAHESIDVDYPNGQVRNENVIIEHYVINVPQEVKRKIFLLKQINLDVYVFNTKRSYAVYCSKNNWRPNAEAYPNGIINMSTIVVQGRLMVSFLLRWLNHEIGHIHQWNQEGYKDYKHLYNLALQYLNAEEGSALRHIAYLLYFFSKMETEAQMHELYQELMNVPKQKPNVIQDRDDMIAKSLESLKTMDQEELNTTLLDYFGVTVQQFFAYINKRIRIFNQKIRRVYGLVTNLQEGKLFKTHPCQVRIPKGETLESMIEKELLKNEMYDFKLNREFYGDKSAEN